MDDEGDVGEVDAARRDVRGHHHGPCGVPELVRGFRSTRLRELAVDLDDVGTHPLEELGGELRGSRRREEAHHLVIGRFRAVLVEDGLQDRELVHLSGGYERLFHLQVRRGLLLAHAVHEDVPGSKRLLGHLLNLRRNRGGEEQSLSARGDVPQNLLDGGLEPHVQQSIRLVEHEGIARAEALAHVPVLEVVDESTGRGDQDVGVLRFETGDVGADVGASEHNLRVDVPPEREQLFTLLLYLRRELTRRGEHQRGDAAPALGTSSLQFLQHGEEKRDGLPRPGLGAREDVLAGHDVGQHRILHLGGVAVSFDLVERAE